MDDGASLSGCDYATNIAQLNIYHLSPVVRNLGPLVPSELQEEPASAASLQRWHGQVRTWSRPSQALEV